MTPDETRDAVTTQSSDQHPRPPDAPPRPDGGSAPRPASAPPAAPMHSRARRGRRIAIVLVLAGLVALAAWYVLFGRPTPPRELVALSGRIEGDDSAVAAKTSGRLREITRARGRSGRGRPGPRGARRRADPRARAAGRGRGRARPRRASTLARRQIAVLREQLRQSELGVEQAKADAQGRVGEAEARLAAAEAQLAQAEATLRAGASGIARHSRSSSRAADRGAGGQAGADTTRRARRAVVNANRRQVEAARGALTAAQASLQNPAIRTSQVAAVQAQILQARGGDRRRPGRRRARPRLARRGARQPAGPPGDRAVQRHRRHADGRAGRGRGGRHPHRHAGEPGRGLPARLRARRDRSAGCSSASRRASTSTRRPTTPIDGGRLAHRSAGLLHAGEHLLPRGPREAGGRREARAPGAVGFAKPGMPADGEILVEGEPVARAGRGDADVRTGVEPAAGDSRRASAAIRVRGLWKRYGAVEAVRGIDFEVAEGEIFGLIGPDGAGKTSTFQILAGVMEATAGRRRGLRPAGARGAVGAPGYLTQAFSLYPDLTVAENLRYVGDLRRVPRAEIIAARGSAISTMFDMDRFTDRLAGRLSGGMKQKLALACALVAEPRVLLLDEPTTGVDPVSRREFWDALAQLARRRPHHPGGDALSRRGRALPSRGAHARGRASTRSGRRPSCARALAPERLEVRADDLRRGRARAARRRAPRQDDRRRPALRRPPRRAGARTPTARRARRARRPGGRRARASTSVRVDDARRSRTCSSPSCAALGEEPARAPFPARHAHARRCAARWPSAPAA